MSIRNNIREYTHIPLTHRIVSDVLAEYNRPNDKISDLVQNGFLVSLRRGLYVPGPELDLPVPHQFIIANHLRGPSYISLETALSHWGLIPEQVYGVSSMTLKTSRTYDTPLGHFSYRHLAAPYYAFGLERVEVGTNQFALMASREKALCDKIITTAGVNLRSQVQTFDFLMEDLRLDETLLGQLDRAAISSWVQDAPKASSLQMLVDTLNTL